MFSIELYLVYSSVEFIHNSVYVCPWSEQLITISSENCWKVENCVEFKQKFVIGLALNAVSLSVLQSFRELLHADVFISLQIWQKKAYQPQSGRFPGLLVEATK